jgi:hypothetical protein
VLKPAVSLQSASRLSPFLSPPPHHLVSLQPLIILALITGIRIAWRVTDICTICILHTRSGQGDKKKSLSSARHPKHRSVVRLAYGVAVPLCMGGAKVQKFSRSAREDLFLKPK